MAIRVDMTGATASVLMPGTCGELVQGAIDGRLFSISCPIDIYSRVSVELDVMERSSSDRYPKARVALDLALASLGYPGRRANLRVSSPLPRSKGMGSSTADVAGAIYAVAAALGRSVSPHRVAELAVQVEPSDGSVFPNVALFDHRRGQRYEDLGPPPQLEIAVLDFGGEVDTLEFNLRDLTVALRQNEPAAAEALALVRRGLRDGRPDLIGRGASLSAEANQRILNKPRLEAVRALARDIGAVGVNVGHSGTVIGILVDPGSLDARTALAVAKETFPDLAASFACRLVGGSYRVPSTRAAWPSL